MKVLPMKYPLIDNIARHAYLLSALGNYEQSYPWIYSNFINLAWFDRVRRVSFLLSNNIDHYRIPWLDTTSLYRDTLLKFMPDIASFVKSCIDDNWYIHTKINEYYIPVCRTYQKEHYTHSILVHGYDDEHIHIGGFFNEPLKYGFGYRLPIQDFVQAFHDINEEQLGNWQFQLFRVPDFESMTPKEIYQFDTDFIAASIQDFLNCSPLDYYLNRDINRAARHYHGLDVYRRMIELVEQSAEQENVPVKFSMVGIYTLFSHKQFMISRIAYMDRLHLLKQADRLTEQFEALALLSKRLISQYARANKTLRMPDYIQMKYIIQEIATKEERAMEMMLNNIVRSQKFFVTKQGLVTEPNL